MTEIRKTILLADHSGGTMPPVEYLLGQADFTLYLSENIVDTLTAIEDQTPDLIVVRPSDSPIPAFEIDGILEAIKGHQLVMLAIPRMSNPDDEIGICSLADDFYVGEDPDELISRIQILSRRSGRLRKITSKLKRLEEESITDFKTELFNDRFIITRLQEEFDRSNRHRLVLSIIMLDFDEFKQINDTLGHSFGDFVLLSFARKLKSLIRKIDIPGRVGGDEFLVVLPNTDLDEAVRIADRIRSIVNSYKFEKDGVSARLTVSLGINAYGGDGSLTWEEFLKGADLGLLAAKSRGKNRIFLFPSLRAKENGPSFSQDE